MRTSIAVIGLLSSVALWTPAHAVDLKDCSKIREDQQRMDCLESNTALLNKSFELVTMELRIRVKKLEETVALIPADLKNQLENSRARVEALEKSALPGKPFKLSTRGRCLSYYDENQAPRTMTWDHPDLQDWVITLN